MEMVSLESKLEKLGIDDGEKLVKHYKSSQKILLVGEGDFSFAACLAKSFGSAANMVATSLDSAEMVKQKYLRAARNIDKLKTMGCRVVHGVNAHSMTSHPLLHQQVFDRIIFNFPHTTLKRSEADIRQIQSHQRLVKGFLRSAGEMLAEKGEAHVTHKTCSPYNLWEIESLAEEVGLRLVEKVRFKQIDYHGYQNKRGFSLTRADETFHVGACLTYKFAKPESAGEMLAEKGEAHVTHRTCSPYNLWEIESLAEEVGLRLVEKVRFKQIDYHGYQNKRGFNLTSADETFHVGACLTYKFAKPEFLSRTILWWIIIIIIILFAVLKE